MARIGRVLSVSQVACFEEAEIAGAVEDDVVEEFDADNLAGVFQLAGDVRVARRRFQGPGGMVMLWAAWIYVLRREGDFGNTLIL